MTKILVLEADPHHRWLCTEELKSDGHQVIAVGRGEQALEVLRHMPIDLVVMEPLLPDGKGLDYLQEMVTLYPGLKVIINTSFPTFKQDFRSWGAAGLLTKSSNFSKLKRAIREVLSRPVDEVVTG